MSFTTQVFLFVFFPICAMSYFILLGLEKMHCFKSFIKATRLSDIVLILFSFGFYMCACFDDIFRFALYILFVYFCGKTIAKRRNKKLLLILDEEDDKSNATNISWALPFLLISLISLVFILVYFKYAHLFVDIWNFLFRREIVAKTYLAPIGLSFITFSAISYIVDIYRGDEEAGTLIDCALYLSFFPKVVSGPIVLWKDFKKQIFNRKYNLDLCVNSLNRIMIGFAKKLILADQFGLIINSVKILPGGVLIH